MEDLFPTAKARSMGILVLEEFACLEAAAFVRFVGRPRDNSYIRWQDPSTHPEKGFKVRYSQCEIVVKGEPVDLHLFDLPVSLPAKFNLNDLIFPVEIDGCLILANRHFGYVAWNRVGDAPKKRSKNILASWLAWIQTQKTLFLVAATGVEPPALTIDQLRDYLDLAPEGQILGIPSHFTVAQEYVFDLNEAKRALTTLVENILTNTAQPSD